MTSSESQCRMRLLCGRRSSPPHSRHLGLRLFDVWMDPQLWHQPAEPIITARTSRQVLPPRLFAAESDLPMSHFPFGCRVDLPCGPARVKMLSRSAVHPSTSETRSWLAVRWVRVRRRGLFTACRHWSERLMDCCTIHALETRRSSKLNYATAASSPIPACSIT
jgi:hypothetical protein